MTHTIRFRAVRIAVLLAAGACTAFAWSGETVTSAAGAHSEYETPPNGLDVISVDLLRHPIGEKARHMFHKALDAMNAGDLDTARAELLNLLAKHPDSAIYVHSVLGVIYVKTNRFEQAVSSFEVAASLLPHDSMTHYNFALSLACAKNYERSEEEARRALALDPKNASAQTLLGVLLHRKENVRRQSGDQSAPLAQTELSSGSERHSRD